MPKLYLVRDDLEECTVVKDYTEPQVLSDSVVGKMTGEDFCAYNIVTTSDKEINSRVYPDQWVKKTVLDNGWLKKYNKPFLANHDTHTDALGRISNAWYIKHSDYGLTGGNGEILPDEVIMHFADQDCFKDGTGSVIAKICLTDAAAQKIEDGIYMTTSQGSHSPTLTCNICNKDYYGHECSHNAGRQYEIRSEDGSQIIGQKKCVPATGELFPIENSAVNAPANDTSLLALWDVKQKKIKETKMSKMMKRRNMTNGTPPGAVLGNNNAELKTDSKEQINILQDSNKSNEGGSDQMEKYILDSLKLIIMTKLAVKDEAIKTKIEDSIAKIDVKDLVHVAELTDSIVSMYNADATEKTVLAKKVEDLTAEVAGLKVQIEASKVADKKEETRDEKKETEEAKVEDKKETKEDVKVPDFLGTKTSDEKPKVLTLEDKFKI